MMKPVFLISCAAMMMCACLSFAEEPKKAQADADRGYEISVGDLLEINVYGEEELSKTVRVAPDGTIDLPLIEGCKVEDLTAREVEAKIAELLEKDYLVNPQVSVFIKEYAKIFVLGQVHKPGAYELHDGLTATGAIAMAGGATDIAADNSTKVIRTHEGKKQTFSVPVSSIWKSGDTSRDVVLEPGDTVAVPESFF